MSNRKPTRRERLRNQQAFPAGMFAGLMTAACVTLIGVLLGLESNVILLRAAISGLVIGSVVSLGVSIVRLADAEHQKRQPGRR